MIFEETCLSYYILTKFYWLVAFTLWDIGPFFNIIAEWWCLARVAFLWWLFKILKKFICWTFPLIFRPKFLYDYYYYFSLRVFFHNHSRITELQGKGEGISLTPHYHFHPLHRHLDISRTITADGWGAGWGLRRGVLEESEDFQSSWLSNVKFKRIHSPLFSHSHSKRKIVWI